MRPTKYLILFLAFSACATRKPLEIPVAVSDGSLLYWSDDKGRSWTTGFQACENCVCFMPDDVEKLLASCKREKVKSK